ncbi:hypothetical protein STEG23_023662, partial [Scotinomys teguina]
KFRFTAEANGRHMHSPYAPYPSIFSMVNIPHWHISTAADTDTLLSWFTLGFFRIGVLHSVGVHKCVMTLVEDKTLLFQGHFHGTFLDSQLLLHCLLWAPAFSMVVKTPVDSTRYSTPAITPFDVGGISLLEDGDGLPVDNTFPLLSLDCAIELSMGRVILKHVDHVVEVNEGVN